MLEAGFLLWDTSPSGLGVAWVEMLVFDSLVFCMTLYKSVVLPRPNRVNMMDILFRDGEF
jgi:hypothetical protein